jgi:pimeloyl-ACP methyl ester carboxylesterase
MPVHVVWGTRDAVVPFKNQPRMLEIVPRATALVLEDCGHTEMFAKFYSTLRGDLLAFLHAPLTPNAEAEGTRAVNV